MWGWLVVQRAGLEVKEELRLRVVAAGYNGQGPAQLSTVVVRIEGRWRSTENENGHQTVCTGCFRPHSNELVVPLLMTVPYNNSFVCHNQRVVGYNYPQPRYSRGTTGLQPKYNLSALLPLASLVRASCCGCG